MACWPNSIESIESEARGFLSIVNVEILQVGISIA